MPKKVGCNMRPQSTTKKTKRQKTKLLNVEVTVSRMAPACPAET